MIKAGTRYVTPGGAELVVTKGGDGVLSDGEVGLQVKGGDVEFNGAAPGGEAQTINLGRRYQSARRRGYRAGDQGRRVRPSLQRRNHGSPAAPQAAVFRLRPRGPNAALNEERPPAMKARGFLLFSPYLSPTTPAKAGFHVADRQSASAAHTQSPPRASQLTPPPPPAKPKRAARPRGKSSSPAAPKPRA